MKVRGRELTLEEITSEKAAYGKVRSAAEIRIENEKEDMRRVGMALQSNADAKLLLEILQDLYYRGNLVGSTPEETYFNLGRRDVVDFLIDVRDRVVKEK